MFFKTAVRPDLDLDQFVSGKLEVGGGNQSFTDSFLADQDIGRKVVAKAFQVFFLPGCQRYWGRVERVAHVVTVKGGG